jgi:hypothetical protein
MKTPAADPAEIRRAADLLFEPGQVVEVRVLHTHTPRRGTVRGYYDDLAKMAQDAAYWSGRAPAVYWTLNPCRRELLARADNHLQPWALETTSDGDILCRRWLPIDVDPVRPAGISSTDEEHELALERTREIMLALRRDGWPEPVNADSGNGGHLLVPLPNQPNDTASEAFVEEVLQDLDRRFSNERVHIDRTMKNASRIVKIYGSLAAKGDDFAGRQPSAQFPEGLAPRPHRFARILA